MSQSSKPIPIAIPNELLAKIDFAASRMPHKSKQDVMRMAMEFGLLDLEAMNYDVEGHAWRAMKAAQSQTKVALPFTQAQAVFDSEAEDPSTQAKQKASASYATKKKRPS
jgi:hypothetical protein